MELENVINVPTSDPKKFVLITKLGKKLALVGGGLLIAGGVAYFLAKGDSAVETIAETVSAAAE